MRRLTILGIALATVACGSRISAPRTQAVHAPPSVPAPPATPERGQPQGAVQAAATGLERFDSCEAVARYLKGQAAARVGPYGLAPGDGAGGLGVVDAVRAPAARAVGAGLAGRALSSSGAASSSAELAPTGPAPEGFSQTNVQEPGVDEPDIVKSDGRRIFAVAGGRVHAVLLEGGPRRVGSIEAGRWGSELLLAGDRLLVLSQAAGPLPLEGAAGRPGPGGSSITVVDVSDPSAMRVVSVLDLAGRIVSARLAGGVARVVLQGSGPAVRFAYPGDGEHRTPQAARLHNRRLVARTTADDWLPRYALTRDGTTSGGRLGSCDATYHPAGFSGFGTVTVATVDPADPTPREAATVVGDAQAVYASQRSLYVATVRWPEPAATAGLPDPAATAVPSPSTEIHRFDISNPRSVRYVASGVVPGTVLNQWSLSEHAGYLRLAATTVGSAGSETSVHVLSAETLAPVGRVGGLGRGERVYAVRYLGDLGFVVTFRQVDPLYVLDLSQPSHPRVAGELEIPGYSAYLHPIEDGYLLGVGQDATSEGRVLGTQVSIFDVRDPAQPRRIHQLRLGGRSEVEEDHHAFLYWPPARLAVMPLADWREGRPFSGAVVLRAGPQDGVREMARLAHPSGSEGPWAIRPIRRALVAGGLLWTASEAGLLASDLETMAERAWVPFA